ncbi:MAG: polysaccharide biosynthesis tyrosine autokinase [Richelia sp. RM2_1_2]|nr:polysaccharide biosynthesis tyrosine autokinase [Richelia sp. SM1_7_0]NJN11350.1 polysaccharide biosynthesis tyrosine autokinase [Richelia sp. RM1_1_1]NJO30085.1 polysaccharide biosynthesis tyrosine autokinase [Richelia sp. SL_2_1]NJO61764.1 polysaccharide biosynthesis tyrosine autokinase [Richelia sp. RM2_1_2]
MENKNYPEEIDIQKYLLVLKRRWLVVTGVFATLTGLAIFTVSVQKPAYEASGKLLFQSNRTSSLTGVGEKIGDLEALKREFNPLDTQAVLVESTPFKQEVIEALELKRDDGTPWNPKSINLKAEALLGTDVLKVSYVSEKPELAKQIVNQVMESFIKNNISVNRLEAKVAGEFIENQIPQARKNLEEAAENLRIFKATNQIIDLARETEGTVLTINSLNNELNQSRSELADLKARESELRSQLNLPGNLAVDITSSQVSGVQQVLEQLQTVQSDLATLTTSLTESHPKIVDLKEKEAALKALLNRRTTEVLGYQPGIAPGGLQMGTIKQNLTSKLIEIQVQSLGLGEKIEALEKQKNLFRDRADVLPNLEKQLRERERQLDVARSSLENLLTRLQEITLAENQTVGNARIIEYADAYSSPQSAKRKMGITAGGIFSGLLLGVASAFFVDLIDRRLKTVKEAEALFGYTVLGFIPKFEASDNTVASQEYSSSDVSQRVIVATSPRTVIHEAYQMLQANLKFISLDKKVRSIAVTSSVNQEGKTEVAANLAAVTAQVGRRVLLVDADMYNPSQHHLWGLINSIGLSNVMVGENDFESAVHKITPNLSVLTAGVMPPNPLALIDSERMTQFIEMLSQTYDCIIFDAPALVGSAEAAVLSQMVDGALVVVRPGKVNSVTATAAKSLLERSETNVLGIVANGVNVKYEPNNYFYYNSPQSESSAEKANQQTVHSS